MRRTTGCAPSPGPTWTTLEPNSESPSSTTSDQMPGSSPSQQKKRRQSQPNTSSKANASPLTKRQRTSLDSGVNSAGSLTSNANTYPSTSASVAPRQHLPPPKSSAATRVRKRKSQLSIASSNGKKKLELEQEDVMEEQADSGSDWSPPPPSLAWLSQPAASGSGSKRNTTKGGPSKPNATLKLQRKSDNTPQQPSKRRATFPSDETIELSSDTEIANILQPRPSTSRTQAKLSTSKSTNAYVTPAATKRGSTAKSIAIIDLCSDEEEEEEAPRKRQKNTHSNASVPVLDVVDLCSSSDEEASVPTSRPSASQPAAVTAANKGKSRGSPSKPKPPPPALQRPLTRSQPQPQNGIRTRSQQSTPSSQKRTQTQLPSQNTSKATPRPPAHKPRMVRCARKSAVGPRYVRRLQYTVTDAESESASSDPPQPSPGPGKATSNAANPSKPRTTLPPSPQIQAPVSPLPPPARSSLTSTSFSRALPPSASPRQSNALHLNPQQSQELASEILFSPREFVASQMEQPGLVDGAELSPSHVRRSTPPLASTVTQASPKKLDPSTAQLDPITLTILADALQRVEAEKAAERKPGNQEQAQDIEADTAPPRRSTRVFKPTLKYQQLGIAVLPSSTPSTSSQVSTKPRSKPRSTSQPKLATQSRPKTPIIKAADSVENEAVKLKEARTESDTKGAEKNERKEGTPSDPTSHSASPGSSISSSSASSETTTTSMSSLGLDASSNLKSSPSSVTTEPEPEGKDKSDSSPSAKVAEVETGDDGAVDDAMHVDEVEDAIGNDNDDSTGNEAASGSAGSVDTNPHPISLSSDVSPPPAQAAVASPIPQPSAKPAALKPAPHPTLGLGRVGDLSPQTPPQSKSPLQSKPKPRLKPRPRIVLPTALTASEISSLQHLIDLQRENLLSKPFTGHESTSKLSHVSKAPDTPPALSVPIALTWPVNGAEIQEAETTWTGTWFGRVERVIQERARVLKEREREQMEKAKESEMIVDTPEEVVEEMDVVHETESESVVLLEGHPNSPLQQPGGELRNNDDMMGVEETSPVADAGEQNDAKAATPQAEVVLEEELPTTVTEPTEASNTPTPPLPESEKNSTAPVTMMTTNDISSLLDLDPELRHNLRLSPEEKELATEHLRSHLLALSVPSQQSLSFALPLKMVSGIGHQAADELTNGDLEVDVVEELLLMYPDEDI